jgi:hypothetical protein
MMTLKPLNFSWMDTAPHLEKIMGLILSVYISNSMNRKKSRLKDYNDHRTKRGV